MTVYEDPLVGIDAGAEERLPERWVEVKRRATDAAVVALIAAIEMTWAALFVYAAYRFIG